MEFIRIISNHYHPGKKRFHHRCFRNYKTGISVISRECIRSEYKTSVCGHIDQFYESKTTGNPPVVYWLFNSNIIKDTVAFKNTPGETGDKCHYDIIGLSNEEAKEIYQSQEKNKKLEIFICLNEKSKLFNPGDYHELLLNKSR